MEAGALAAWVLDADPQVRQARALLQRLSDARDLGRLDQDSVAQQRYINGLVADARSKGFEVAQQPQGHVTTVGGEKILKNVEMIARVLDKPRNATGATTYGQFLYILASGVAHGLPWAWVSDAWTKPTQSGSGRGLRFEEEVGFRVLIGAFNLFARALDGLLQLRGHPQLHGDSEWNRLIGKLQAVNETTTT